MTLSRIEKRLEAERKKYELLVGLCDKPVIKEDYLKAISELRAALGMVQLVRQGMKAEVLRAAQKGDEDD